MDSLEDDVWDNLAHLESGVLKSCWTMIAPCFDNLSKLKVLDLSRTNIQSLPPSISMLHLLVNLTLQECSMLTVIPPEIGILKNLVTFDLEGTEIMYLPIEMRKLENLQCLRVSFCAYADEYKDCNGIDNIIPRMLMSKLSKLEELSICVNPDAKWWETEVLEAILEKLHFLPCLRILKLYLPALKELQYFLQLENCNVPIYSTLRDFRLKIGHCEQLPSYLKTNLVDSFEKLEKCLKYENGEGSIDDHVKELVRHTKALFVCRHLTIEKLSVFDISRLKYCLLVECNNMRNVVDADDFYRDNNITNDNDGNNAFEFLEYLAIHSMKNLERIWKGPIARNSFNRLQVFSLHTCPDLTAVFTGDMLDNLQNLTVVIVEDCPKLTTLVSWGCFRANCGSFLPNLKKILLLDLPELVSLSNGVNIAPLLDTLLVFNCLKLDCFSHNELSRNIKEIKGETEWWDVLKNKYEYLRAFVPLKRDGDLMNQLAEVRNSLKEFCKLQSRDSQPLTNQFHLYETKKHIDWGMFMQFLNYRKPPVPLSECNSFHVMEFFKYLNKFGDIRVHLQSCVHFGHPNRGATCFCPLREAWGTLDVIARRLHVTYEENKLPYSISPFDSSDIRFYLNENSKVQENASDQHESNSRRRLAKYYPTKDYIKKGVLREGRLNNERQRFRSKGAVTESIKVTESSKAIPSRSSVNKMGPGNKSVFTKTEVSTNQKLPTEKIISLLKDEFRTILHAAVRSMDYSMSVDRGSTNFPGTLTQGSSSIHEVKQDDHVISSTMSPRVISQLRNIAVNASSKGYIQPLVEIYIAEQKTMIQSRFTQFDIHKWSTNIINRFGWGVLEPLIKEWIKSVQIHFEDLYASEKKLCEEIFQGLGINIEDICYEVIIQNYQIHVFNIIYTLSFTNPPPDKLFLILDLYQTLDHFLNETCSFAKTRDPFQATVHAQLLSVLADKIINSLSIFEMVLLYHESSVIFVGPVDPLPRYVMSYLCQLCDHMQTLRKLSLPKLPSIDEDDLILYSEELKEQREDLSRHVIWIIMMIVSNMEGKAKLCEDGSAGHFFAMKNISYIVNKIEGHRELKKMTGYDYYGKLIQKLDYAKFNYLRLELEKIIQMRDYGAE